MNAQTGGWQAKPANLARNSGWNLAAFACALAANFVTVPFVVRWAGLEAFGRAGIVLAVCAPLMLIGTVLGQAVTRELAGRAGGPDELRARRVLDAALRVGVLACAAGWLALVAVGPAVVAWLTRQSQPSGTLTLAFMIAATGWAAQQIGLLLQGACAARQDFRTIARIAALSAAATVAAVLALTWLWPTTEGYLAGVTLGFAVTTLAWITASRGRHSGLHILRGERREETSALMHFGKWQGLAQLAGAVGNQIDRYALAALAPVAVVGHYNVANRLQEAAYIGVIKAGEVLFPRFGSMSSAVQAQRRDFFQVASWVVGAFSAAVLAPLVPLADATLLLWVGPEASEGAGLMLRTLILGGIVGAGSNVFVYYAMGMGRTAAVAMLSVVYSIVTVAGTVLLLRLYGPQAAGAGLLLASVMRIAMGLQITRRDFFPELGWSDLAVSTVLPLACGAAVALAVDAAGLFRPTSWIALGADYAAIAAIVLLTVTVATALGGGRSILSHAGRGLRSIAAR